MSEQAVFRVRVFFGKTGRLTMLSHLEVARSLERAIRRAGLPYAVSLGFSPHMKISFGAALPVGIGGIRECFDLQLTRYAAPAEVLAVLRKASVCDLMVTDCMHLGPKAPAASVAYPVSTYRVDLAGEPEGCIVVPDSVTVVRKKKEKKVHVRDYLVGEVACDGTALEFSLRAHATGSLRVDAFVSALAKDNPGLHPSAIMRISQV